MPSATKAGREKPAAQRRFGRSSAPAPQDGRRFARSPAAARGGGRTGGLRRRRPEPSGFKKIAGSIVPGAKKAAPSSRKGRAGGLALLAAAAGVAFKSRGKLAELRRGDARREARGEDSAGSSAGIRGPVPR